MSIDQSVYDHPAVKAAHQQVRAAQVALCQHSSGEESYDTLSTALHRQLDRYQATEHAVHQALVEQQRQVDERRICRLSAALAAIAAPMALLSGFAVVSRWWTPVYLIAALAAIYIAYLDHIQNLVLGQGERRIACITGLAATGAAAVSTWLPLPTWVHVLSGIVVLLTLLGVTLATYISTAETSDQEDTR